MIKFRWCSKTNEYLLLQYIRYIFRILSIFADTLNIFEIIIITFCLWAGKKRKTTVRFVIIFFEKSHIILEILQ